VGPDLVVKGIPNAGERRHEWARFLVLDEGNTIGHNGLLCYGLGGDQSLETLYREAERVLSCEGDTVFGLLQRPPGAIHAPLGPLEGYLGLECSRTVFVGAIKNTRNPGPPRRRVTSTSRDLPIVLTKAPTGISGGAGVVDVVHLAAKYVDPPGGGIDSQDLHEHPVVVPQDMQTRQLPLRRMENCPHCAHMSPVKPIARLTLIAAAGGRVAGEGNASLFLGAEASVITMGDALVAFSYAFSR